MLLADVTLARRLERSAAESTALLAEACGGLDPAAGAGVLRVAGGVVVYAGASSLLNGAVGLGMDGPVRAEEIDEAEEFLLARGSGMAVAVCPLAHESLLAELRGRGYGVAGFENVLVRPLGPAEELPGPDPAIAIRPADTLDEREAWARMAALGFSLPAEPRPAHTSLARAAVEQPHSLHLIAYVDGEAAGTGELLFSEGIGWLSGDTTLPEHRGRGVQTALQLERLRLARDAGCDIAATESAPGSASQRNQERRGFRLAYTRADLMRVAARR